MTIRASTLRVGFPRPGPGVSEPVTSLTEAKVGTGKKKLEAKRDTGEWYRDRQRREIRTMVTDKGEDYYRQTWYHEGSGDEYSKVGRLKDPDMHGPESAKRVQYRNRHVTELSR